MKIKNLIEKMQELESKLGDVECFVFNVDVMREDSNIHIGVDTAKGDDVDNNVLPEIYVSIY